MRLARFLRHSSIFVAAFLFTSCGDDHMTGPRMMDRDDMPGGMGRGPVGVAGPGLVSMTPAPGSSGVSADTSIRVQFTRPMAPGMEQWIDLHEGDVSGAVVPWSCAWSSDATLLTCDPQRPLSPATAYVVHLGGGMRGADGSPVDFGWGPMHGGAWLYPSMGRHHAGHPWGTMDPWRASNGSYGMVFGFTTA